MYPLPFGMPNYDADAQVFITAAGITDATQKSAINRLVLDLKAASIWTKFKAIYPFVGGTASTHKWNLKDPRDLDAAYRLTFSGTWTHSSNGADPSGTPTYANTYLAASAMSTNSNHISFYSRENVSEGSIEIGGGNGDYLEIELYTGGLYTLSNSSSPLTSTSIPNTQGLFICSRTSSVGWSSYRNSTNKGDAVTTPNAALSINLYIGARNNNGTLLYQSSKQCAFATIGDGLSSTEVTNFYNAVQTFQTTLSRQV